MACMKVIGPISEIISLIPNISCYQFKTTTKQTNKEKNNLFVPNIQTRASWQHFQQGIKSVRTSHLCIIWNTLSIFYVVAHGIYSQLLGTLYPLQAEREVKRWGTEEYSVGKQAEVHKRDQFLIKK